MRATQAYKCLVEIHVRFFSMESNQYTGKIVMADRCRVRERAFSLPSSTVGVLHQSHLSSTRRFRKIINQRVVVRSIRRNRRRVVAHIILLVVVALFWRQATFSSIQRIAWSLPRHHRQRKAIVPYSGKLLWEETFGFFHGFRTIRESFLCKFLWRYIE